MTVAYNVVDADGHVLEPLDLWDHYIDPKFRDRAPRLIRDADGKTLSGLCRRSRRKNSLLAVPYKSQDRMGKTRADIPSYAPNLRSSD